MRQGITGLVAGIVLGSVLAGSAAFGLGSVHSATPAVPATPKAQLSDEWASTAHTGMIDANRHAIAHAAKPVRPAAKVAPSHKSAKAAVKKHMSTPVRRTHSTSSYHRSTSQGTHGTVPAGHGTVPAAHHTDTHMSGHDGESSCN